MDNNKISYIIKDTIKKAIDEIDTKFSKIAVSFRLEYNFISTKLQFLEDRRFLQA